VNEGIYNTGKRVLFNRAINKRSDDKELHGWGYSSNEIGDFRFASYGDFSDDVVFDLTVMSA